MTLLGDGNDVVLDTETMYDARLALSEPGVEIRVPSEGPSRNHWDTFGERQLLVHDEPTQRRWLISGGHALVLADMLPSGLSKLLGGIRCRRFGSIGRFYDTDRPPRTVHERFARGRLRQTVMNRDENRCRICGRSPDDALDVRLDVHHILPAELDGWTVEDNLVTLCKTCHDGMNENLQQEELFEKIAIYGSRTHRAGHDNGVRQYRKVTPTSDPHPTVLEPLEWGREAIQRLTYAMAISNVVRSTFTRSEWRRILKLA
jgi:5-methylcytosine-specific restriction endonuclease McrA